MLKKTMKLSFKIILVYFITICSATNANQNNFDNWVTNFKIRALESGVSESTFDKAFKDVKFISKLLIYDKKQPEFIELTHIYVGKRVTKKRIKDAKKILKEQKKLLNKLYKEFKVPPEYLVALWGVETSFGKHRGKVNIISALATLSYDKRRSKYFSNELITLLNLLDKKIIKYESLYGSWAGAHGNFQFMPSSIKNYALDYDKNGKIDLVNSLEDSFASAANYLNKIGWNNDFTWGSRVFTSKTIDKKIITTDARKLKNQMSYFEWKKLGISKNSYLNNQTKMRLVRPDGEKGPFYLVSTNYEKLLNWNRSLRFAISIGTFADKINNEK